MILEERYLAIKVTNKNEIKDNITKLILNIKENNCTRKNVELVYTLKSPLYMLPKEKVEVEKKTKWESFAKEKGISKKKKSFFKYDEKGEKEHRYGALSEKNKNIRSGIYEEKVPLSKIKKEKENRIKKNSENKKANLEKNKK